MGRPRSAQAAHPIVWRADPTVSMWTCTDHTEERRWRAVDNERHWLILVVAEVVDPRHLWFSRGGCVAQVQEEVFGRPRLVRAAVWYLCCWCLNMSTVYTLVPPALGFCPRTG